MSFSHVRNYDILISSIAATIAGAISYLGHIGLWFGGRDDEREGSGVAGIFDADSGNLSRPLFLQLGIFSPGASTPRTPTGASHGGPAVRLDQRPTKTGGL